MATTAIDTASAVLVMVYGALNVASITTTLNCGVSSHVERDAPMPYLRISSVVGEGEELETFGKAAEVQTVQLSVFSDYAGEKEALAIRAAAVDLLVGPTLSVSGYTLLAVRRGPTGGNDEDDGGVQICHRWVQLRVYVQQS